MINKKILTNAKKPGKKRQILKNVSDSLKKKSENVWASRGPKEKYIEIFNVVLKNKPMSFLVKRFSNKKQKPNIMFLGPAKGNYIPAFKKRLKNYKIEPNIDVFALTKNLSLSAKKIVRKDYSSNMPFEELNTIANNLKIKLLQKELLHTYDLIMAPLSVGFHTIYPANALFTSALLLSKKGRAYVEVEDYKQFFEKTYKTEFYSFFKVDKSLKQTEKIKDINNMMYSQKQVDNMQKIFNRFVFVYNKKNKTKLKFALNKIIHIEKENYFGSSVFFEIERIN
jgi:hypothetical protein